MLMALDLPLPKKLLVHGFVNASGAKMSKTVGNIVDPMEVIDGYGADAFRYYFSRHIPTLDDGDFTWEKFENAYNNELANELGNLASRIANMVKRYQSGVAAAAASEHDEELYHQAMAACEFNRAVDQVWLMVRSLNQYLEEVKPWAVAKERETNPEAEAHLSEILNYAVGTLQQIARLLEPFLPTTAAKLHELFKDGVVSESEAGNILFPKYYNHTPNPQAAKQ